MKDKIIKKDTGVVNRSFSYLLDGIELKFTLRVDIKQELKNFLAILGEATKDVQAEIDKK